MNVILLERIEKLGQIGDLVKVKPGYGRNFLLPKVRLYLHQKKILKASRNKKFN